MIDVIILGAAHPHVQYALTEAAAVTDVRIVAAAEPDATAREQFLGRLDCPVYPDPRQALADHPADVALICGVYSDRAELIIAALQRKMAVLADKPMCTDLDQLRRIEDAATQAAAPLAMMFDKRFYPETRALQSAVEAGELGRLVYLFSTGPHKLLRPTRPDWFFRRATYGGIANDLPIHDIDILLRLTGIEHGSVTALTGNRSLPQQTTFEDHVALMINSGDLQATIDANWLQPEAAAVHGDYRMRVVGTDGSADLDWPAHSLTITTHRTAERVVELPEPVRPVQFFFDALRAGDVPAVTTAQSIRATRIALLAQLSADRDGAWQSF